MQGSKITRGGKNPAAKTPDFYCIAHYGEIFFSERMSKESLKLDTISFDGIFYTCPKQFKELCTNFGIFQRDTFPAIHCLLTCKKEELYIAVLSKILQYIPQLSPKFSMPDWEKAAQLR